MTPELRLRQTPSQTQPKQCFNFLLPESPPSEIISNFFLNRKKNTFVQWSVTDIGYYIRAIYIHYKENCYQLHTLDNLKSLTTIRLYLECNGSYYWRRERWKGFIIYTWERDVGYLVFEKSNWIKLSVKNCNSTRDPFMLHTFTCVCWQGRNNIDFVVRNSAIKAQ
jgi:hypothetical protein